jgi:hypothetical protein
MTDLENGMRWRVMVELIGADGVVFVHEVSAGGSTIVVSPATVGLTMTEGKQTLAGLQRHLIQAQVEDHCRERAATGIFTSRCPIGRLPEAGCEAAHKANVIVLCI